MGRPADGTMVFYSKKFSNNVGEDDAVKLSNLDENIALVIENQKLAFSGMNLADVFHSDTIPISMWNLYDQDYVLRFNLTNDLNPEREILLLNKTTGIAIKLPNNKVYDFSFRPQPGVTTNDQYALVFNTKPYVPKSRTRKNITVYPNPVNTNSLLQIILPDDITIVNAMQVKTKLEIYDLRRSRIVNSGFVEFNENKQAVYDIADLPEGVYSIRVYLNNRILISNLIKQ